MVIEKISPYSKGVTLSSPETVDFTNVQYYCHHTRSLKSSQQKKALTFVEYDCVRYVGGSGEFGEKHAFVCLPLNTSDRFVHGLTAFSKIPFENDYNTRCYEMFKLPSGQWTCNCQGWESQKARGALNAEGVNCSHLLALFYCFKMKRFGRTHGATEHQIQLDPHQGNLRLRSPPSEKREE